MLKKVILVFALLAILGSGVLLSMMDHRLDPGKGGGGGGGYATEHYHRHDTPCPNPIKEKTSCRRGGSDLCSPRYCN